MRFQYHFAFGIVFTVFLYFLLSPVISLFGFLIIFLSSFLIDVDHYFYYVRKKRDLSLFRAYKWYMKNARKLCRMPKEKRENIYLGFYLFHGIEPLAVLLLLGLYVSPFFSLIFIGFLFHLLTDLVGEIIVGQRIDKISVIYNFIVTRKMTALDEVESD